MKWKQSSLWATLKSDVYKHKLLIDICWTRLKGNWSVSTWGSLTCLFLLSFQGQLDYFNLATDNNVHNPLDNYYACKISNAFFGFEVLLEAYRPVCDYKDCNTPPSFRFIWVLFAVDHQLSPALKNIIIVNTSNSSIYLGSAKLLLRQTQRSEKGG